MEPPQFLQDAALRASGLVKRYGALTALAGIDLVLPVGAAFGLVGANGAGKTTLIKCMLDFCSIDTGSIRIFGREHTAPEARSSLSFVPERFVPPHYLKCREFIEMTLSLAGAEYSEAKAEALFGELALDRSSLDRPVRQLSKGMTQKLGLAGCLLIERQMYVLDEPMSGLDPLSRVAVKSVLARLTREGRTLFFTSHVLADVEELCSSIAVLHRGAIRYQGSPIGLCERFGETHLESAFIKCIRDHESANNL